MQEFLIQLWNMSCQAGIAICMVLIARLIFSLMNIPRKFSYTLWIIPFFRLVCPRSLKSPFSIFSYWNPADTSKYLGVSTPSGLSGLSQTQLSDFNSLSQDGFSLFTAGLSIPSNTGESTADFSAFSVRNSVSAASTASAAGAFDTETAVFAIWLAILLLLLLYNIFSCFQLKKKLTCSICIRKNIYLADAIDTPFVFGLLHPTIYLPSRIQANQMNYAILHEQIHIRRKDYFIKFLAFFITCSHWFNPLAWIAFFALERDMEMSCDEAVIEQLGVNCREAYASALLTLTAGKRRFSALPPAFGKNDTKRRITHIMKQKKTLTAALIAAVSICIILAAFLLTDSPNSNMGANDSQTTAHTPSDNPNNTDDSSDSQTDTSLKNPSAEIIPVTSPSLSPDTNLGADGPQLYYADHQTIIFHGYFGLFVYSLKEQKILRAVDTASIGCNATQGDSFCEVQVAADGSAVYMHPIDQEYMYVYDIAKNQLSRQKYNLDGIKLFKNLEMPDELPKDSFHSQAVVFHQKSPEMDYYGYLTITGDWKLKNLHYVESDMVFQIFRTLPKSTEKDLQKQLLNSGLYAMEVKKVSATGLSAILYNHSDQEIVYGEDYQLSRLENGKWVGLPYIIENWGFNDIACLISPRQSSKQDIDWEWLYGKLPKGTYQLTKTVYVPQNKETAASNGNTSNGSTSISIPLAVTFSIS
ncbi:MAG: M56 family metallopeptidase [Lachnospiraceae bacterium]|nr:M56 family metallopeptidase [Lachnospiraceae bacterium]